MDNEPTSSTDDHLDSPGQRSHKIRPIIAGVILAIALAIVLWIGPNEVGEQALELWDQDPTLVGGAVFAVFYILAPILFVPAALLAVGAGFLFGGVWGTILALTCRPLGSLAVFLTSRYVAHDMVQRWVGGWERFKKIDALTTEKPLRVVLLMRLFPIVPFNLANYLFGITHIDWRRYTLATAAGVAPGNLVYVYLGVVASDLTRAVAMEDAPTLSTYLIWWGGAVVLLVSLFLLGRLAKKGWDKLVEEEAPT